MAKKFNGEPREIKIFDNFDNISDIDENKLEKDIEEIKAEIKKRNQELKKKGKPRGRNQEIKRELDGFNDELKKLDFKLKFISENKKDKPKDITENQSVSGAANSENSIDDRIEELERIGVQRGEQIRTMEDSPERDVLIKQQDEDYEEYLKLTAGVDKGEIKGFTVIDNGRVVASPAEIEEKRKELSMKATVKTGDQKKDDSLNPDLDKDDIKKEINPNDWFAERAKMQGQNKWNRLIKDNKAEKATEKEPAVTEAVSDADFQNKKESLEDGDVEITVPEKFLKEIEKDEQAKIALAEENIARIYHGDNKDNLKITPETYDDSAVEKPKKFTSFVQDALERAEAEEKAKQKEITPETYEVPEVSDQQKKEWGLKENEPIEPKKDNRIIKEGQKRLTDEYIAELEEKQRIEKENKEIEALRERIRNREKNMPDK